MTKVAFMITVYKNDKIEYFKEAIDSILQQDYGFENINIYLGIDGYLDSSIRDYIETNHNNFYKIIKNDKNSGLAYTLNRLIDELEDEKYIFRMDSDDICILSRVTEQVNYLDNNSALILGTSIEEFNSKGVLMIRTYPKTYQEAIKYITKGSIFAHPSVCFHKDVFNKGFRYDSSKKFSQDLALWFDVLFDKIEVSNLDKVLVRLRVTNSFYKRRNYKKAIGEFRIYWQGIKKLYGFSISLIFPILRLFTRLMPSFIVKLIYSRKVRSVLNK